MVPEAAVRYLACHDLAPGDLADKVEKVRAAIERDDFRSPDVKKLGLGGFYRAKLDDAARLLLMFAEHRGEKACLALEGIRGHAYYLPRSLRRFRRRAGGSRSRLPQLSPAHRDRRRARGPAGDVPRLRRFLRAAPAEDPVRRRAPGL